LFSSLPHLLWQKVPKFKELFVITDIILGLVMTPYQCLEGLKVQNIEIKIFRNSKQNGFTLVEIIAVLAIIAILASLSMPRFIDLSSNASHKAFQKAVSNLNNQESLTWGKK
jgi:prepilin-type N-terminal cleavage/methylation domain-containing protein